MTYLKGKKAIPELRFSNFETEWKESKLEDVILIMQSGLSRSLSNSDIGLPVVRSNNLVRGRVDFSDIKYWYADDPQGANTSNYFLKENDILLNFINSVAQIGKVSFYEEAISRDVIFTTNLMRLSFKEEVLPKLMYYIFNTDVYFRHINAITKPAVNQASFTTKDLKKMKFSFPEKNEQEKIVSFLSFIDKKITLLEKQKKQWQKYKKGSVQKIFSQQTRFTDDNGNQFPDWEERELSDVLGYLQPTSYIVDSTEYSDGYKTPVLTAGKTFILGYTNETNGIFNEQLPVIIFDDFTTAIKFVDFRFKVKSSAMKILISKNDSNIKYIYEFMKTINFKTGGHGRHWISKYSKLSIQLPSKLEQQKIISFLSGLDTKIEMIDKKITQSKQWKKGLLQKMFV